MKYHEFDLCALFFSNKTKISVECVNFARGGKSRIVLHPIKWMVLNN